MLLAFELLLEYVARNCSNDHKRLKKSHFLFLTSMVWINKVPYSASNFKERGSVSNHKRRGLSHSKKIPNASRRDLEIMVGSQNFFSCF